MTRTAIVIRIGVTVAAVVGAGLVLLTSGAANRRTSKPCGERSQLRRHREPSELYRTIDQEVEP